MSDAIAERAVALCTGVVEHAERDSDAGDAIAIDYAKRLVVVVRALLAERAKDGEALVVAKAALDAAESKMREIAAERDHARDALAFAAQSFEYWKESHEALLVEFHERGGRLHELIIEHDSLVMRVGDVASEAFGPFPVQTAAEALSAIEHGCFEARKENAHVTSERDEARARCTTAQSELLPTINALTSMNTQLGRELVAMTAARDEACRAFDGCIADLAEHEDDPGMMDGHRALVAALRAVGGK